VETLLACFQRGQPDLCRRVDDDVAQYEQVFSTPVDPSRKLVYRVVEAHRLNRPPAQNTVTVQTGDVLIILAQHETGPGWAPPETDEGSSGFILRRLADGTWKIVYWGEPEGD
jgi:hypothetical protein